MLRQGRARQRSRPVGTQELERRWADARLGGVAGVAMMGSRAAAAAVLDGEMAMRQSRAAHKRCSWSDSAHHTRHSSCLHFSFLPLLPSLPGFVWCQLWALPLSFIAFPLAPGLLTGAHSCTSVHWCWSPCVNSFRKQASQSCPPSAAASTCLSPFLLSPRLPSPPPRLRSLARSLSRPSPSAPSSATTPTASVQRCSRLPLPARFLRGNCPLFAQRTHR